MSWKLLVASTLSSIPYSQHFIWNISPNPIGRINVSSARFCKTTDELKLNVSQCPNFWFSISLLSQHCAYALVWFRHKHHTVRVRKNIITIADGDGLTTSWKIAFFRFPQKGPEMSASFHIKQLVLSPQKQLEMSAGALKKIFGEVTQTAGRPFGSLVGS